MPIKNYVTDESCPKCGEYILVQLRNHVFSYGGGDFETQCHKCNNLLDIVVEPVPSFSIKLHAAEQQDALEVAETCDCGEQFPKSGYCKFCGTYQRYRQ